MEEPDVVNIVAASSFEDDSAPLLDSHEETLNELRIEETVSCYWSGVSGCGDSETVNAEANKFYNDWVQKKRLEYPNLIVKKHGHMGGTPHISRSGGGWPSTGRTCRATLLLPCYIVFYQ